MIAKGGKVVRLWLEVMLTFFAHITNCPIRSHHTLPVDGIKTAFMDGNFARFTTIALFSQAPNEVGAMRAISGLFEEVGDEGVIV